MMRRFFLALIALAGISAATPAWAQEVVSVADLLADPAAYDNRDLALTGELIGDYGHRSDGTVWTQLNGDSYTTAPLLENGPLGGANVGVGIRGTAGQFADLDPPGRYTVRGPLVRAVGIWRYHDETRSGESYLDVLSLEILEPGRTMHEAVDPVVLGGGALLTAAAVALGWRILRSLREE